MSAMLPSRIYHRGSLVDANGNVSALCFKKPHAIDLKRAFWTNRDEAVTCPKCLELIRDRAATSRTGSA